MSGTGNGGNAWNWTALSRQAVARNTAHAEQRQSLVAEHVKAAAAAVRRPAIAKKPPHAAAAHTVTAATKNEPPAPPLSHPDAETEQFSRIRIADRKVAAADLAIEMDGRKFIPLRQMDVVARDVLADEQVDWVTIGVVARKTLSKAAANGSSFMVWALSDLDATELAVFLFDAAYDAHWRALEGSVVAVLNAPLMPASEKNKFALKVAKSEEIVTLGRAVDFGICKGMSSADVRCRLVVNTAKSQYCLHHIASSFMAAGKRRQQLNNSFSTFNKSMFSSKSQLKNISAGVYGARPTPVSGVVGRAAASNGWHPIITGNSGGKRKRTDSATTAARSSGAVLGVPTVISSSGAVMQRPAPTSASAKRAASAESQLNGSHPAILAGTAPRASRGQKIIASMIAKPASATAVFLPNKKKKVDMIKFMKSGAQS